MPQSLAQLHVHLVFSTKDRYPFLVDANIRHELHSYLAAVLLSIDSPADTLNSTKDHIHVLFRLSKTRALSDVIQEIKTSTSKWIKIKDCALAKFGWQNGYGAFSVSESQRESVRAYIQNQEEHHREVSFEDEFRKFLLRHGVEFDERYLWD